ncbi:MAG: hypothetical protein CVT77_07135 [Alphaproteobacteria bacterium HGW-Alphaproteobacteria-16]|nr:MAG: hypothetical protein CVT77_07135 [Alphaproteobacteria bacterium HGW-Alphaproteobacteria-16]
MFVETARKSGNARRRARMEPVRQFEGYGQMRRGLKMSRLLRHGNGLHLHQRIAGADHAGGARRAA